MHILFYYYYSYYSFYTVSYDNYVENWKQQNYTEHYNILIIISCSCQTV